ncbi:MvdC/MvdD family ATP grasp protein [Streptomyces erythrochromogenes]|uniref:MvdC/MvdD family ATP grasp protein n=1 Tax=Streptomyces erythrochromogenes TaxID=285574 RepID=UPI0036F58FCB
MTTAVDLLVIGTSIDPHIDAVLDELPPFVRVVRFDVDRFPRDHRLTVHPTSAASRLVVDEATDVTNPGVVWFRRLGAPGLPDGIPQKYRRFSLGEAEQALEGLLGLVRPRAWINEYWATRRAANKPYQYRCAVQAGLSVPETVITNDPLAAKEWLGAVPDAIAKTLHSPMVTHDDSDDGRSFAFTRRLTQEDRYALDDVATTPCQFQPSVAKAFELRVTSIGGRHHAVRIDAAEGGCDDWRPVAADCSYTPYELDGPTQRSLTRLLSTLGIQYAASDFIVTPDGNVVFLESNPHGAWLWLEERVPNLGASRAIAEHIADHVGDGAR